MRDTTVTISSVDRVDEPPVLETGPLTRAEAWAEVGTAIGALLDNPETSTNRVIFDQVGLGDQDEYRVTVVQDDGDGFDEHETYSVAFETSPADPDDDATYEYQAANGDLLFIGHNDQENDGLVWVSVNDREPIEVSPEVAVRASYALVHHADLAKQQSTCAPAPTPA